MVGIGPGARSYTQSLHYSSEYAVAQSGVRQIIAEYQKRSDRAFTIADYGVVLDSLEQRRRFVIKSLLRNDGLCLDNYADKFASDVFEDLPQLYELLEIQLAIRTGTHLHLNPEGMSWSDVIGPWLYSSAVISKMEACDLV